MAELVEQVLPEGAGIDMLDEVTAEMGVEEDPPDGMVVHVHFVREGRARIVDVWESADALEAFRRDRLVPALRKVMERRGMSMDGPQPETTLTEVAAVRGR